MKDQAFYLECIKDGSILAHPTADWLHLFEDTDVIYHFALNNSYLLHWLLNHDIPISPLLQQYLGERGIEKKTPEAKQECIDESRKAKQESVDESRKAKQESVDESRKDEASEVENEDPVVADKESQTTKRELERLEIFVILIALLVCSGVCLLEWRVNKINDKLPPLDKRIFALEDRLDRMTSAFQTAIQPQYRPTLLSDMPKDVRDALLQYDTLAFQEQQSILVEARRLLQIADDAFGREYFEVDVEDLVVIPIVDPVHHFYPLHVPHLHASGIRYYKWNSCGDMGLLFSARRQYFRKPSMDEIVALLTSRRDC